LVELRTFVFCSEVLEDSRFRSGIFLDDRMEAQVILVIDDERTFNTNYEQIVYARSSREGMSELALAWTNFSLYY